MTVLIPIWFFESSFIFDFLATVIGLLLSYFSFKLYNYTKKNSHLYLSLAFIFITLGFGILTLGNIDSLFHFEQCESGCVLFHERLIYDWIISANYSYYIASLIGYAFLAFGYLKAEKKKRKLFSFFQFGGVPFFLGVQQIFVLFPFETAFFQPFHAISSILLLVIVWQTFSIYRKTKLKLSLFVAFAFVAILLYHALLFAIPYSPLFFALAHISLLVGFSLLLFVLIKVNK